MSLVVLGLSHHGAPLSLLESVALDPDARTALEQAVLRSEHVTEAVVVSTCNRTEVYAECLTFHGALADITAAAMVVSAVIGARANPACAKKSRMIVQSMLYSKDAVEPRDQRGEGVGLRGWRYRRDRDVFSRHCLGVSPHALNSARPALAEGLPCPQLAQKSKPKVAGAVDHRFLVRCIGGGDGLGADLAVSWHTKGRLQPLCPSTDPAVHGGIERDQIEAARQVVTAHGIPIVFAV